MQNHKKVSTAWIKSKNTTQIYTNEYKKGLYSSERSGEAWHLAPDFVVPVGLSQSWQLSLLSKLKAARSAKMGFRVIWNEIEWNAHMILSALWQESIAALFVPWQRNSLRKARLASLKVVPLWLTLEARFQIFEPRTATTFQWRFSG